MSAASSLTPGSTRPKWPWMLSPLRSPWISTPRLDRRGDLQCRLACGISAASSGCGFPCVPVASICCALALAQTYQLRVCAVLWQCHVVPSCWQVCSGQIAAWVVAWLAMRAQMPQLCVLWLAVLLAGVYCSLAPAPVATPALPQRCHRLAVSRTKNPACRSRILVSPFPGLRLAALPAYRRARREPAPACRKPHTAPG